MPLVVNVAQGVKYELARTFQHVILTWQDKDFIHPILRNDVYQTENNSWKLHGEKQTHRSNFDSGYMQHTPPSMITIPKLTHLLKLVSSYSAI